MMSLKDKLRLAVVAMLENDRDEDFTELFITNMTQSWAGPNPSLTLLFNEHNEERQKHFRLGHSLEVRRWITNYADYDFHQLFRMKKETFFELVSVIQPMYYEKTNVGDTAMVDIVTASLTTIWYLAGQCTMLSAGDRFGIAPSTVHNEIHHIVDILCTLSTKFIVWPTEAECQILKNQFFELAGYPDVIGAIDGCHITVLAPADEQSCYTDRKMNHSIILQGICTAQKIFTNVSIGTPGSRNDCRALRFSEIHKKIQADPHNLMYNDSNHLLGDKAYPNRTWLMAPYKDYGDMTELQKKHNFVHSSTRTVIEHTFGLLKGRWRCLLGLRLKNISRDTNFVLACCVLHNFCYLHNDNTIEEMIQSTRTMARQDISDFDDAANGELAKRKRDRIASTL